ncbi:MAG: excinuclease ABC subunit UvrA [Cytophagales bacterium]|nr:excinuclease ABC subunit UvrA [Bernardetiaceae bacterium]MDW8206151.1 excinuclease ABC subunit UvrA [Cytophagales bacterium]
MPVNHVPLETLDPREYIIIKGAKVHNLRNLSVAIPRNKLVVITGLSGSGKSSLAFDTLFAEGQRMYVESLSSYARQFLGRMEKPDVEYIKGISPAIAVEQKVNTFNPRSTVGTTTEIYDYLKLLFARIGKTYSPISGNEVRKDTVADIVDYIQALPEGERFTILCPLHRKQGRNLSEECKILLQKGFTRLYSADNQIIFIEELINNYSPNDEQQPWYILVDRNVVHKDDPDNQYRTADSVQTAFFEGEGVCIVVTGKSQWQTFSDKFEADGMLFEEPSVNLFSFNNAYGACKNCEGFGTVIGIDPDLVIPNKDLSVYEGAIAPWRSDKMREWLEPLIKNSIRFDFPIHRPYKELTPAEQQLLWTGNQYFKGLNDFFAYIESQSHLIKYRVILGRYRGRTTCPECRGTRLRKDALYVKINGFSIADLVLMPISDAYAFFKNISLTPHERQIAQRIVVELQNRLEYLVKVGLSYLTLNRLTSTLSGGEYQRIKLATSLGSSLVGSMYILDEPSIGLHPRDTHNLIAVMKMLRDIGNTVIVVEHEEEVIRQADQIIDIGPGAGIEGGQLIFQGTYEQLQEAPHSLTARYLLGLEKIKIPTSRRAWKNFIQVSGAREHNLKNITVKFPLHALTVVTGVSGSGKSTLIRKILHPALSKYLGKHLEEETGNMDGLSGDLQMITHVEFVDQNPIGTSSRSNPVTYIKAYDSIRQLFSEQPLAKQRGYKPGIFSFNINGGRCEICYGEGVVSIAMQFMADIHLPCEACRGKRFKQEVLDVEYQGKNISDVLDMTVSEAMEFFRSRPKIVEKLRPLYDVGLGYIRLGQASSTLSGGEAQRVKLASFLGKGSNTNEHVFFIFDEPTTGLHFHDIHKLLHAINALVEAGNTVLIIEHNMEVIKSADWIIDLGPEGGSQGGYVVFEGTPEEMVKNAKGYTAAFLAAKLKTESIHSPKNYTKSV